MTIESNHARGRMRVNGTALHYQRRGNGAPLLLIHGAGEDAGMLAAQADAFAEAGYDAITYDRRGTGSSGRDDWPGNGAPQHADDAAALLKALEATPATVLGLSSGGVIALALASRHPDVIDRVVAWEAPAAGVVSGGAAMSEALVAPVATYLDEHPGDYAGAQAMLLTYILGFPVEADDPAFEAARRNAEPMIRDDPRIAGERFDTGSLGGRRITIAVGDAPNEIVAAAAWRLAELAHTEVVRSVGSHEVYLEDASVLVGLVGPPR